MQRGLLAVLLVSVLATLCPLAHATPPDQTWQAGIYDAADFDDVVIVITTTTMTAPPDAPQESIIVEDAGSVPPARPLAVLAGPCVGPASVRGPPCFA